MKTYIARSVFETQAHLEQAIQVDRRLREEGNAWISLPFQTKLVQNLAQLRQSAAEHSLSREAFLKAQTIRNQEMTQLRRLVRDFFQVLKRRSQRHNNRPELEALFQRPTRVPQWASVGQWLQWAKQIIEAESEAQTMGYPAMANPSASDIEQVLNRASACQETWSIQVQALKLREEQLRQSRLQGTQTLRGLALRLREVLTAESPATRRELMRTYGFSFISTGTQDRQTNKPGDSNLATLIPNPQSPQITATKPQSPTIPTPATTKGPKAPSLLVLAPTSSAPAQKPPTPAPAPTAQIQAKHEPNPAPPAQAQLSEIQKPEPPKAPDRNQRLGALTDTQSKAEGRGKKLSRRQKKALQRAQRSANDKDPARSCKASFQLACSQAQESNY